MKYYSFIFRIKKNKLGKRSRGRSGEGERGRERTHTYL
jgi:hypothetical protein